MNDGMAKDFRKRSKETAGREGEREHARNKRNKRQGQLSIEKVRSHKRHVDISYPKERTLINLCRII